MSYRWNFSDLPLELLATQEGNKLFAKKGNKDRAAGIIVQFQSPTERGMSDRQRALRRRGLSRSLDLDWAEFPCIFEHALFSEIDDHPTPDLSCEDFGRQRWHVVQSRVSRHAVELCEVEVDCQATPRLFALLTLGPN